MGLANIPPELIEPLACLEDLVRDQEEIALTVYRIGRENDGTYLVRWKTECPEWFALVQRARKSLESLGIKLRHPHERKESPKPQGKSPACRNCRRKVGHRKDCERRPENRKPA